MLPALIAAGATLAGGYMASQSADSNAAKNIAMQKEFAQNGIRWKVADAKAAGVHPLYAMGAQTSSFAPVSFGAGMGPALASMGQDVSRSMNATSTASERATNYSTAAAKLQLENMSLQNMLLASRVKTMNQAGGNPPMPEAGGLPEIAQANKQKERPPLQMGGVQLSTDPTTSNASEAEERHGEAGGSLWGLGTLGNDLVRTFGSPTTWPQAMMRTVWSKLSNDVKSEYGNFERFRARLKGNTPMTGGGW